MRINRNNLEEYFNKLSIGDSVWEVIISTGKEGIKSSAMMKGQHMYSKCDLLPSAFTMAPTKEEEVGIKDIRLLKSLLARFKSEVTLKINNNILVMDEGSKEIQTTVASKDFIEKPEEVSGINYEVDPVMIEVSKLKDIGKDITLFKECEVIINGIAETNIVEFHIIDGTNKLITKLKVDKVSKDFTSMFKGDYLLSIIKILTANRVKLQIQKDYPMKVVESTEHINSIFMVAPRVEGG